MKTNIIHRLFIFAALCALPCSCARQQEAALKAGFAEPTDEYRPWCYWWWQNGNVDRETVTADLEAMKEMGFGGLMLFDARGYWDDDDHVRVPAPESDFMSDAWIDNVCFALREADRLGLKVTLNLSSCAGSLKGPWEQGGDSPKQLLYHTYKLPSGQHLDLRLPAVELPYFQDVALFAVRYDGTPLPEQSGWKAAGDGAYTMSASSGRRLDDGGETTALKALEVVELTGAAKEGRLDWDVPEGQWTLLRFGWSVIPGFEYDVDILDPAAVTRHVDRMVEPFKERVGDLFGKTLTHFYSVSWEGSVPTWSLGFEEDFKKSAGYELRPQMPMLAGFEIGDGDAPERFIRDYRKARNDMFRENFYLTLRKLAHGYGLSLVSESGGPWKRNPAVFQEADQLEFLAVNDMPQGEFWCNGRSHLKGTVSTAHMYGLPRASAEAFTHMAYHWSMYPHALKPLADQAFLDGINHFVWHTFTCSPDRFGVPGGEYFAGTHVNRNVTWQAEAGPFLQYLARCQFLLQQGLPVVDIAVWAGDRCYQGWGHFRDKPYDGSSRHLPAGYNCDLMNTDVLLNRAKAKNGRIVLPDGMSYSVLVIDPEFPDALTAEVQRKIDSFREAGVQVVTTADGFCMPVPPDFEGCDGCAHRRSGTRDIYFVAGEGPLSLTFRASGKAEIWDAVSGTVRNVESTVLKDGRSVVHLQLPAHGSAFVVFDAAGSAHPGPAAATLDNPDSPIAVDGPWELSFRYHKLAADPPANRIWEHLGDLTSDADYDVRHFSGTVSFTGLVSLSGEQASAATALSLGDVTGGLVHVYVNGADCGTVWTSPWEADIAGKLKAGENEIRIDFTNTWQNRLIGDCALPEEDRLTRSALHYYGYPRKKVPGAGMQPTVYSGYSAFDPLCPNGVLGPVAIH